MPKDLFDLKNTEAMDGNSYMNDRLHQAYHHYIKVCDMHLYFFTVWKGYRFVSPPIMFTYIFVNSAIHFVEVSFCHVFFLTIPLSTRIFADTFIDCLSIYRWCRLAFSPFLPEILSSPTRWSSHLKWWMWETDNRMILHDTCLPRLLHNLVCIARYL